jgi:hypothetical protein
MLKVMLTDAPLDLSTVQSVNVTLTGVIVYPKESTNPMEMVIEGSPISLLTYPATFDLLTLTGGATALLASGEVPVGTYSRISLEISEATLIKTDSTTTPLKIESNKVDVPIRGVRLVAPAPSTRRRAVDHQGHHEPDDGPQCPLSTVPVLDGGVPEKRGRQEDQA